jgi:hypothetical protein
LRTATQSDIAIGPLMMTSHTTMSPMSTSTTFEMTKLGTEVAYLQ